MLSRDLLAVRRAPRRPALPSSLTFPVDGRDRRNQMTRAAKPTAGCRLRKRAFAELHDECHLLTHPLTRDDYSRTGGPADHQKIPR